MENNYKPNSKLSRDNEDETKPKKKVEKVVTGKVKSKKRSELHKLTDVFAAEDVRNVKSFLLTDVLIPAVIDMVEDLVTKGIRMALRGDAGGYNKERSSLSSRIQYNKRYDGRDDRRSRPLSVSSNYSYDDIILDSRGEAEDVLISMDDVIDRYGMVSVADLYEMVGISGTYTDNKYGWTNLRSASPQRVREGYLLKLPRAIPFD